MNINFSSANYFGKVQNILKPTNFSSNPIKFQGNLEKDKFESTTKLSYEEKERQKTQRELEEIATKRKKNRRRP